MKKNSRTPLKIFVVFVMTLLLCSCSSLVGSSNSTNETNTIIENTNDNQNISNDSENGINNEKLKEDVVKCFEYYYQGQMDAFLFIEEKSFLVWQPVEGDRSSKATIGA